QGADDGVRRLARNAVLKLGVDRYCAVAIRIWMFLLQSLPERRHLRLRALEADAWLQAAFDLEPPLLAIFEQARGGAAETRSHHYRQEQSRAYELVETGEAFRRYADHLKIDAVDEHGGVED